MVTEKQITKIRTLYFDKGYSVTQIASLVYLSINTIYKYLNHEIIKKKCRQSNKSEIAKYIPIIEQWIKDDRNYHYKQRHTAKRVFDRLYEIYPEFDLSYDTVNRNFRKIFNKVYLLPFEKNEKIIKPGEAFVEFVQCTFMENDKKYQGKLVTVYFPYSKASFSQIFKGSNPECLLQGLKNIFNYIKGVPHTISFKLNLHFDNKIHRSNFDKHFNNLFLKFKFFYDFKDNYSENNLTKNYSASKFLIGNFFVPIRDIVNIDHINKNIFEFNEEMLNRKIRLTNNLIKDLFERDKINFLPLPDEDFDVVIYRKRKTSLFSSLNIDNRFTYYLSPLLSKKDIYVGTRYNEISFYYLDMTPILTMDRLYGKSGQSVDWYSYLPALAKKTKGLFHTEFPKLMSKELKEYLLKTNIEVVKIYINNLYKLAKLYNLEYALNIINKAAKLKIGCDITFNKFLKGLKISDDYFKRHK